MPYKVLVRSRGENMGHTASGWVDSIGEARGVIDSLANTLSEGDALYIRYTQASPGTRGYHEPNIEAYKVKDGVAELVWNDPKHRGMREALGGY